MKIIAINASPRAGWNTDILVREAAAGAVSARADVEVIDLYKLAPYTGCVSCFGCKTRAHLGRCICRDGLSDVLEKIRTADGLILGSPVYLGDIREVWNPSSARRRPSYPVIRFRWTTMICITGRCFMRKRRRNDARRCSRRNVRRCLHSERACAENRRD